MESENEIELSLGLSCGHSVGKGKSKDGVPEADEGACDNWALGEQESNEAPFRRFFNSREQKQDQDSAPTCGFQDGGMNDTRRIPHQGISGSEGSLFNHLQLTTPWPESSNKRRFSEAETHQRKKHEGDAVCQKVAGASHGLGTADDDSCVENEDLAESEAENSTSKSGSQCHGVATQLSAISDASKDKMVAESARPTASECPFMELLPSPNSEQPVAESTNRVNSEELFGYSVTQLPTLENFSAYTNRLLHDPLLQHNHSEGSSKAVSTKAPWTHTFHVEKVELELGGNEPNIEEAGALSSALMEGETKTRLITTTKKISTQLFAGKFPQEHFSIRPGVAADMQFGGCGSCPDLPWVSTIGTGPHGRTISGVTYRCVNNQVRIVCACHGSHMSPDEFVQHANSDAPEPRQNVCLGPIPSQSPESAAL